jgi:hypothetical protein
MTDQARMRANERAVLQLIETLANNALPAPTRKAMAKQLGMSEGAAESALDRLRKNRTIKVERDRMRCRFTIVATGARTSWTARQIMTRRAIAVAKARDPRRGQVSDEELYGDLLDDVRLCKRRGDYIFTRGIGISIKRRELVMNGQVVDADAIRAKAARYRRREREMKRIKGEGYAAVY